MDYVLAQYPAKCIRTVFDLTEEQINVALSYIDTHQIEIETEYKLVLKQAEKLRQYYEEQNRERVASDCNFATTTRARIRLGKTSSIEGAASFLVMMFLVDHNCKGHA